MPDRSDRGQAAAVPARSRRSLSLPLYRLVTSLVEPVAPWWLGARARRGKEDRGRWRERLGVAGRPRPPGPLAWLHGVSVGESLSLLPLVERLRAERPDVSVLVTSGTRASADLLLQRLPIGVVHQFAPLDTPRATRRFLDHWRPAIGVFVESELWPNLILCARARGARLALVSARLSERSFAGWRRAGDAAAQVLGAFDLLLARDHAAGERLAALGARVDGCVNLKFGASPLPVDGDALARIRTRLGRRPVIVAASTHPGEDAIILDAFRDARRDGGPLLIVAPRHPSRGAEVQALAREKGLQAGLRSAGASPGDDPVYVADTVGELGLWFRLAHLAVMGGSLIPDGVGGHNPLEPARLGCPVISGRGVAAWPMYEDMEALAATQLAGPEDLVGWFSRAIAGPSSLAPMAQRAKAFAAAGDAAVGDAAWRVIGLLES